ncbi:MAG: metalloprotease, partial [Solimonas sp.]
SMGWLVPLLAFCLAQKNCGRLRRPLCQALRSTSLPPSALRPNQDTRLVDTRIGYIRVGPLALYGAQVHVHWTVIIAIGILLAVSGGHGIGAVTTIFSYLGILFVHESGHALMARYLGYRPFNIYLGVIHGLCEFQVPYNRKHAALIAWGGVLAQLAIAIPLIVIGQTTRLSEGTGLGPVFAFLGYISFFVALFNLAPAPGMDGSTAWSLFPILLQDWRLARRKAAWQRKPKSGK